MTNFVVMDSVSYPVSLAAVLVLLGTSSSSIHLLANWTLHEFFDAVWFRFGPRCLVNNY